jgi:hypothetical protein
VLANAYKTRLSWINLWLLHLSFVATGHYLLLPSSHLNWRAEMSAFLQQQIASGSNDKSTSTIPHYLWKGWAHLLGSSWTRPWAPSASQQNLPPFPTDVALGKLYLPATYSTTIVTFWSPGCRSWKHLCEHLNVWMGAHLIHNFCLGYRGGKDQGLLGLTWNKVKNL